MAARTAVFAGLVAAFRNQASSQRLVTRWPGLAPSANPRPGTRYFVWIGPGASGDRQFIELPARLLLNSENRAFWEAVFSTTSEGTKVHGRRGSGDRFQSLGGERPQPGNVRKTPTMYWRLFGDRRPEDQQGDRGRRRITSSPWSNGGTQGMMASRIDVEGCVKNKDNFLWLPRLCALAARG